MTEITGKLYIRVVTTCPPFQSSSKMLSGYPWEKRKVDIMDARCTKAEADIVVARWREKNPNVPHEAVWEGPVSL